MSDTIPSMTANSSVNVNLPIEHVISEKPFGFWFDLVWVCKFIVYLNPIPQ